MKKTAKSLLYLLILLFNNSVFTQNIKIYVTPPITETKILPYSDIPDAYISNTIFISASQGEYEPASFTVKALANDITDLVIEPTSLIGTTGNIPAENIDIKVVKCWYQASDSTIYTDGNVLTPELLLNDDSLVIIDTTDNYLRLPLLPPLQLPPFPGYIEISDTSGIHDSIHDFNNSNGIVSVDSFPVKDSDTLLPVNIASGTNKQFWITIKIPDNAQPGVYNGTITLKNGSVTIGVIDLTVNVLPITLSEPYLTYSIYYRGKLYNPGSITSEWKSDAQFTNEMEDLIKHGVTNPTVYQSYDTTGIGKVLEIRNANGMDRQALYYLGINIGPSADMDTISLKNAVINITNCMNNHGVSNLYIYAPDEQSVNDSNQRSKIKAVNNAEGKVFDAQSPEQADSVANILDLAIVSPETYYTGPDLDSAYNSNGHKIFSYGNPQCGVENPEIYRRNYGLFLWQNDYDGAMDYAYQHGFNNIWDDFDNPFNINVANSGYRDHVMAYPTVNGVIGTIQWEGWREGVDDIRYLTTLQKLIDAHTGSHYMDAQHYLDILKTSDLGDVDLNKTRQQIIQWILCLTGQGPCTDLYIQDTPQDLGIEPNYDTGPMWVSEDIWTRNQNDGLTNEVQQNPEYSPTVPNYVYVKVHNRGCLASQGTEQLNLRWAKASTGLSWPDSWDGSIDLDPGTPVALAGDIIATQTIPVIQPGASEILVFPWFPTNPADYTGINTEPWHFCLLARIVTGNDPMASAETTDLNGNVKNNNNIAWKNLTVVDEYAQPIEPGSGKSASIIIHNVKNKSALIKLKFDNPAKAPFINYGSIKIDLGPALFQKWDNGGRIGSGVEVCSDSSIHLLSPHSWIGNIQLDSSETMAIKAIFNLIIKPEECNLNFDISQYTSYTSGDSLVGGNRFAFNACSITNAIRGTLTENPACGDKPVAGDTLVLASGGVILPDSICTPVVTDTNGNFRFYSSELAQLDTIALYSIVSKSGIELNDTAHKTIARWISESPLNLYYTTTVNREWVARYNGADSLDDFTSALDLQGNIYVTGSTSTDTTAYDMLTIKYDSSGTQKWAATYRASNNFKNDNARAITVDASGNIYITGESDTTGVSLLTTLSYNSSGTLRWVKKYQPSTCAQSSAKCILQDHAGNIIVGGTSSCTSPDGKKIFTILKYDTNGNLLWSANYTGPATVPDDNLTALTVDYSNNVYASGYSQGVGTNYDMATVKFNSSGTQLWVDRYDNADNGDDYAYSSTADNNGNVIVTGHSHRSNGNDEIAVIKYNHNGTQSWVSVYNSDTHDYAYKALCNDSNEVYIGGYTGISGNSGMLTLKYNTGGSLLWQKYSLTSDMFTFKSAAFDIADNIYITGTTAINDPKNTDITTQKLNSEGEVQWTVTYNGPATDIDFPSQIMVSANGNVYVSANSMGNSTDYDFTTIKYSQCLSTAENLRIVNPNVPANVVNTIKENSSIQVIPNPNNGNMQVVYEIPENTTGIFEVYNMMGKKLFSYSLFGGKNTFSISRSDLNPGIYYYRATAGNKLIGKDKIVVIK